MVSRKTANTIRKAHRYLGIFLGIQFIFWTLSGLYFSWTDIDEIHGDQFRRTGHAHTTFQGLLGAGQLLPDTPVQSLELLDIGSRPYYWVNQSLLLDARTGQPKNGISQEEALLVAEAHMLPDLEVSGIRRIDSVGPHHEYRSGPLPAYEISYREPAHLKAYVAMANGAFQTVRHRSWRWFDFLWMTHTMDYQGRDDFNTTLLRAFSLLGLITVLSGFVLWGVSSPRLRRAKRLLKSKKHLS